MRLLARSTCKLCGRPGRELYGGLHDRLFSAPGTWSLKECPEASCGLLWLDPEPGEEDIGLLYRSYYTHGAGPDRESGLRRLFRILLAQLLKGTPVIRDRKKLARLFVDEFKSGDLLEVGCGAGHRLAQFAQMGWRVLGQEIDAEAAAGAARQSGVAVHVGPLAELRERGLSFDVIVINHVIEHVVQPVDFLGTCLQMLRPRGEIICVTPNARSWGHGAFGSNWMSLDPPRHVSLFTAAALRTAARNAGFDSAQVFTTCANAQAFAAGSLEIANTGRYDMNRLPSWRTELLSVLAQLRALRAFLKNRDSGDELVLRCQAP
jgi:2-polyprenyl-3-methyl-5-hydroxy-6-metoxy-1,4-benzoquinol methylase